MERYCPWEDVAMGLPFDPEGKLPLEGRETFQDLSPVWKCLRGGAILPNHQIRKSFGQMQISKRFMELGDKEEAVRIASNIASDAHKAEAFVEISKVLKQLGKKEESKQAPLFF